MQNFVVHTWREKKRKACCSTYSRRATVITLAWPSFVTGTVLAMVHLQIWRLNLNPLLHMLFEIFSFLAMVPQKIWSFNLNPILQIHITHTLKIHNSVPGSTLLSAWLVKPAASTPLERKNLSLPYITQWCPIIHHSQTLVLAVSDSS